MITRLLVCGCLQFGLLQADVQSLDPANDNTAALQQAAKLLDPAWKIEAQSRDARSYDFAKRHQSILERNRKLNPQVVMLGDSLIHHWGGEPAFGKRINQAAFEKACAGKSATNMGFGFDYIENVIWRVQNGELDHIKPEQIVLLIGTNNIGHAKDGAQQLIKKYRALLALIAAKQPQARLQMVSILPRKEAALAQTIRECNAQLKQLAAATANCNYLDAYSSFAGEDGVAKKELLRDVVHPNAQGYEILGKLLGEAMQPQPK